MATASTTERKTATTSSSSSSSSSTDTKSSSSSSLGSSKLVNYVDSIALAKPFADRAELGAVACSSLTNDLWDGDVSIIDASSASFIHRIPTYGGICTVAWAINGPTPSTALLLAAGDEGIVYVWQLTSNSTEESKAPGTPVAPVTPTSAKKAKKASSKKEAAAADEKTPTPSAGAGAGASAAEAKKTPPFTHKVVATLHEHNDIVSCVAPSLSSARSVATASFDNYVRTWDLSAPGRSVATFTGHEDQVSAIAWRPNEPNALLSASRDGKTMLWDTRASSSSPALTVSLDTALTSLAWSPADSSTAPSIFAVGGENGSVSLYDIRSSATSIAVSTDHKSAIRSLSWNGGGVLASASDDTTVRISRATTSSLVSLYVLSAHTDYVRGLGWSSSNSGVLVTGSWDKTVAAHRIPL